MQQLSELIARREEWLVERTIGYAKRYGYTPYTSTLAEAWRASICGLSAPLIKALEQYDEPPQLVAGEHDEESITAFGIAAARRHRSRGITLGLFMGLMKYYRQSYLDLLGEGELPPHKLPRYHEFVMRFFDRMEIGFCSEWASQSESELVLDAQDKNRALTHEKNKYLTLFERQLPSRMFRFRCLPLCSIPHVHGALWIYLRKLPRKIRPNMGRKQLAPTLMTNCRHEVCEHRRLPKRNRLFGVSHRVCRYTNTPVACSAAAKRGRQ